VFSEFFREELRRIRESYAKKSTMQSSPPPPPPPSVQDPLPSGKKIEEIPDEVIIQIKQLVKDRSTMVSLSIDFSGIQIVTITS